MSLEHRRLAAGGSHGSVPDTGRAGEAAGIASKCGGASLEEGRLDPRGTLDRLASQ